MSTENKFIQRFSDKAENYHQYRPGYPHAAIVQIFRDLPINSQFIAADIGAGTGISANLLAQKGIQVIAVEPNAKMRAIAQPHPLVKYVDGHADKLDFADNFFDLVTSFQAFHWFPPEASLREFARVLKPSGRIALVWNDLDTNHLFSGEYYKIIRTVADNSTPEQLWTAIAPLTTSIFFTNLQLHIFPNIKKYNQETLTGLVKSISWFPNDGNIQQQVFSQLLNLISQHSDEDGFVELHHCTRVYTANLA